MSLLLIVNLQVPSYNKQHDVPAMQKWLLNWDTIHNDAKARLASLLETYESPVVGVTLAMDHPATS